MASSLTEVLSTSCGNKCRIPRFKRGCNQSAARILWDRFSRALRNLFLLSETLFPLSGLSIPSVQRRTRSPDKTPCFWIALQSWFRPWVKWLFPEASFSCFNVFRIACAVPRLIHHRTWPFWSTYTWKRLLKVFDPSISTAWIKNFQKSFSCIGTSERSGTMVDQAWNSAGDSENIKAA